MPLGQQKRSGGKDRYCAENDHQRPQRRDLKPARRNHLPADEGQYCREYTQTVYISGQKQQAYGNACRQPDGSWQVVSQ